MSTVNHVNEYSKKTIHSQFIGDFDRLLVKFIKIKAMLSFID